MIALPRTVDGPLAVIGDIHGNYEGLISLLRQIAALPRADERTIVLVGDLVDRGPPHCREVIEQVLDLRRQGVRITSVMGNHDLAMLGALGLVGDTEHAWRSRWLSGYDVGPTFASYGVTTEDCDQLRDAMPESHRQLLLSLPWIVEHPDYLIVHAGLSPRLDFPTQLAILRQRDFSLNAPEWLCSRELAFASPPPDCRQTVVSGHVFRSQVTFGDRRILVDTTGGLVGRKLSCVLLPERDVLQAT